MTAINPYLNFDGNCEEAFNFYHKIFGGKLELYGRFKDMAENGGVPIDLEQENRIMHVCIAFDNGTLMMGSDSFDGCGGEKYRSGNNMSVSLNVDSRHEADRIFEALSPGATGVMPLENAFWGDYFGALTDRFGINWMISFAENQPQHT